LAIVHRATRTAEELAGPANPGRTAGSVWPFDAKVIDPPMEAVTPKPEELRSLATKDS
jgi:hypothetical protein